MSGLMIGAAALLAPSAMAIGLGLGPPSPEPGDAGRDPAAMAPAADADPVSGPRLSEVCRRVPVWIERVAARQDRLHSDAQTPGSIAFLQARIERAESSGQADTARLLGNRLATRRDVAELLPDVLARLQDSEAVCTSRESSAPVDPSGGPA